MTAPHNFIPSKLGHGEQFCTWCHSTNRELAALNMLYVCDMAPEPEPVPAKASSDVIEYLDGVVGIVEANSFENMMLWERNRTQIEPKSWVSSGGGYLVTMGEISSMPVCVSILSAMIDGQKILFWHATSKVVDHRLIDAWFKENLPKSAFRSDGYVNGTDAMNFHNVFRTPVNV